MDLAAVIGNWALEERRWEGLIGGSITQYTPEKIFGNQRKKLITVFVIL